MAECVIEIRHGEPADLPHIARIQAASSGAATWNVAEYLQYYLLVAIADARVAGFLVSRSISPDECELLNLAVAPEFRRQGIGGTLVRALQTSFRGSVFLEVRASNESARKFYNSMGFLELSLRKEYYDSP